MSRHPLPLAVLLAATACTPGERIDPTLTEDIARVAGEDVARLAFAMEDLADTAAALPDDATAEECHTSTGDCELCFAVQGDSLSGDVVVTSTPDCGATWSLRGADATYTIAETDLAGTWSADAVGEYTIALSGARAATLLAPTSDGTVTHTANWDLTALTATTSSFDLSTVALDLSYTDFAAHRWDLSLTGDAAGPVGTLAIDDRSVSCSVGGTWESPSIRCL